MDSSFILVKHAYFMIFERQCIRYIKKIKLLILKLESLNFKLKINMAYDGVDNINPLEALAAIEAEMNLFENSSSGHTYTNMHGFKYKCPT